MPTVSILSLKTFSYSPLSIEGERVKIDGSQKDNGVCNVVIKNAGLEDNGIWSFEIVAKNKKTQKFRRYSHEATIIVRGKNFCLKLFMMLQSNILRF